jgi:peptide/nickel transport system permease protein
MTDVTPDETEIEIEDGGAPALDIIGFVRRNPTVTLGSFLLLAIVLVAIFAPLIAPGDPQALDPIKRLRPPSRDHWFGTDMYGRDVFTRTIHGSRISLIVGALVALISVGLGLVIGLVTGYVRALDGVVMRVMDGLMAIPDILLAIALMALFRASVTNVVIAVTVPQVPRVARLVRAIVLTIRELPYIEAAQSIGTRFRRVLTKHLLPNTIAPLVVQATYTGAAAVLTEAGLSFLGAGTPPNIPSWGNMMAEGRTYFQIAVWILLFPGLFLAITVLAVNLLGDGLRDALDPRLRRRM